jgi:hypothetical protein
MQAIPLGLVIVPTAGEAITIASLLTPAQAAAIPGGVVKRIDVWPNPQAAGIAYVKAATPAGANIVAAIPPPTAPAQFPWSVEDEDGIPYEQFSLDVESSGDGAGFLTLWVD